MSRQVWLAEREPGRVVGLGAPSALQGLGKLGLGKLCLVHPDDGQVDRHDLLSHAPMLTVPGDVPTALTPSVALCVLLDSTRLHPRLKGLQRT